ncbi:hypothetical protein ACFQ2K_01085 [Streptomyces sanglieri]|uniref:Uncharacterized protein n=1 Tax=Streptomyces sanglieri TaxID=193460 RepID=A0ABW2WIX6_9ACTN
MLDRAGSTETVRASDRTIALAARTRDALLRTTGWEAEALARLTVWDVALLDGGQTVEFGGQAPDSPARQHVGWRTGALVAALAADRAEDELLLDDASDRVAP